MASPLDLLAQDAILPVKKGVPEVDTSQGSIQHTLTNELPYSVTDPGRPGALSQFRGLGRSSDETDVQALGIPLNYPQGGGFDFSSFPQFFWSEYRFQAGPSAASLDPRGISGTLSLTPWTAKALGDPSTQSRFTALYSNSDLTQLSIGGKYRDRLAVLVGNSSGLSNGPSGALSGRLYQDDALSIRFHLLATDLDSEIQTEPPQPIAEHLLSVRTVPVVQADWEIVPGTLLKSSLYYDNSYLRTDEPSSSFYTKERIEQFGTENALFVSGWKFGASSREIRYHQNTSGQGDFNAPEENISSFQVSKRVALAGDPGNELIFEPTVQGVNINRFGFYPEGTVGIRQEWDESRSGVYLRGNFARRFPSLVDRFYNIPASSFDKATLANPDLQPEKDLTAIGGVDTQQSFWDASIQAYYQIRYDAEVQYETSTYRTLINSDNARIFSLVFTAGFKPVDQLRVFNSVNYTSSRVNSLGSEFPYMPKFIDVLGVEAQVTKDLSAQAQARFQSQAYVSSFTRLASVSYVDLGASYLVMTNLKVLGRVENLIGNDLILDPFSPPKGRVFSIAVAGTL
jgi:hypothetical protein